jgi:hypothetical protein
MKYLMNLPMREKVIYRAETPISDPHNIRSEVVTKGEVMNIREMVLDILEYTQWASKRQLQIWIRGFAKARYGTIDRALERLVRKGRVRAAPTEKGNGKAYGLSRKTKGDPSTWNIPHWLGATEVLMRLYRSEMDCELIPESDFRGFGSVPEWGIKYHNVLFLGEFSTRTDVKFKNKIPPKLRAYEESLPHIEQVYAAEPWVIFVLDISREELLRKLKVWQPDGPFLFTDYETFCKPKIAESLIAKIYLDAAGKEHSLR